MGLFSSIFGEGGSSDSQAGLNELRNIPLPVLKEYYPDLYKQVVSLNPEMETAVNLGPSEMQGISTDPAMKQAQMRALQKLSSVGDAGGRDAQFLADTARTQDDVNSNLQGQQGAIMQNLAQRGMSGSGNELVARQMAAQNASNQQSRMAMDANAQAQQRALQAISQSGQLGGQMQSQDFSQQAQKAGAADAINRFNAANKQQIMSQNVANKNQAQQYNAGQTQSIANQNTGLNNQAQQYNNELDQKRFGNQMQRATGVANQYNQIAAGKNADRAGEAAFVGGLINAGASAYAGGK